MKEEPRDYITPSVKRQFPNEVLLGEVDRMLSSGRDVVLVPRGRSMLPFIRGEVDKVLLRKLPESQLKIGDIVLAYIEGRYVMHRIISLDGERMTLMGDGNLQGTEEGVRSEVVGKVIEIITPTGRHLKPTRGRLWCKLLPIRKYLLKIYRKWNKWRTSFRIPRSEVPRQKEN